MLNHVLNDFALNRENGNIIFLYICLQFIILIHHLNQAFNLNVYIPIYMNMGIGLRINQFS